MTHGRFFHHFKYLNYVVSFLAIFILLTLPGDLNAKGKPKKAKEALPWPQNITSLVGEGSVLIMDHQADPDSQELFAFNAGKAYVPASILKIVTSGVALEVLGPEYRFQTDFLLTKYHDLWVVGYGDPYLVSEELIEIVKALKDRGLTQVRNIYLDNSYFEKDIILDGNTKTHSAYDAYNLAFGVNFNTVFFKKNKKGQVSKACPYTPLTPMTLEVADRYKGRGTYRVNLFESPQRAAVNSGQVLQSHLEDANIKVSGAIIADQVAPLRRKVFYRHQSSKPLKQVLQELMKYSNNFMTNQIFLAMGAQVYGAPATLEKSQKVMDDYFKKHSVDPILMRDGSGLSRLTTLTARQMAAILAVVAPDRRLFTSRDDGEVYCKTGTLSDVKTLAGYIEQPNAPDRPLSFVILLNGDGYTGQSRDKILSILKDRFTKDPPSAGE